MVRVVVRSLLFGLAGLVAVPIVTTILVLVLAHLLDDRCGTPGDSGGCEMGAVGIGLASAIPGFVLFFVVALFLSLRRRRREGVSS